MIQYYAYWNEYFGYKFSISEEALKACPSWRNEEEFPPLSPKVAIGNSRPIVKRLLQEVNPFEPRLSACSLQCTTEREVGWWYYLVTWFVPDLEDVAADWSQFSVPVLFDGSTPEPVKFRYEDRFYVYRTTK